MLLEELIKAIKTEEIKNNRGITSEIKGIAYNSNQVKDGYLFVAIEGFKNDGHLFIEDAVKNGASALLVEKEIDKDYGIPLIKTSNSRLALAQLSKRFYNSADEKIPIIGITGTNGKTTTTFLIEGILNELGFKTGLISTEKNKIGEKEISAKLTTPESLELHELFQQMVACNVDFAVMEVSSHSLELNRVAGVDFARQVFTNLGKEHLAFHGSLEKYFTAKAKLFTENSQPAIINSDDAYAQKIKEKAAGEVITYGIENEANFRAVKIKSNLNGISYRLETARGEYKVDLNLLGEFNVYNSLAAIATLVSLNFELEEIIKAISQVNGAMGRAQIINSNPLIMVDGAHNRQGIASLKETVASFEKNNVFVVLSIYQDKNIDAFLEELASFAKEIIICRNSNQRAAGVEVLADKVAQYTSSYIVIKDLGQAITYACQQVSKKDLILITGSLQTAKEASKLKVF